MTQPEHYMEQARQLVSELDRKLEKHRGSGCAGAQCPDFQDEQARVIASFAAEAATAALGQAVAVVRESLNGDDAIAKLQDRIAAIGDDKQDESK